MKKILLLVLFISFCCPVILFSATSKNTSTSLEKSDYRFDPFQWIYPEYYYKADIIPVQKEKIAPDGYTKVEFFGLTAYIPSNYTDKITREHDIMSFWSKAGDRILMLKATNDTFFCSDEKLAYQKDYCSAYKTPQELFHKLFTLTPDIAENIGDKWIIHDKGLQFDNAKKIEIHSDDKFMAYVKFIKDSLVKKTEFSHEITLFHANGPLNCYVNIRYIANDDTFLKYFISTIE